MDFIDTSLLADRIYEGKRIDENVCMVSLIEYPSLAGYDNFYGKVIYPDLADLMLALEIQKKLMEQGRMQGAADLIIAATCINQRANLLTADSDYEEISKVSDLKVIWE